ncbi:S-methyl-5'-thioinosine phosphorylase [Candidatus Bathyarchaeota archaeon]|nr:S-methyl-5'-thioinosine phosphorylase [Candidatus Bathyarchaeota archaeon]
MLSHAKQLRVKTPYGTVSSLLIGKLDARKIAFIPRHGLNHSIPPHKINYRANLFALCKIGVECVIGTNAVGAINTNFKPADIVVPHDFVDFTRQRSLTFYDKAPVTHTDFSHPYCPELRRLLIENSRQHHYAKSWDKGVLVCTEGPRFETPAEIEMFRRLGCDVVGMTGLPEAILARELKMCYAALCFVSNMAAGLQEKLTPLEVSLVFEKAAPSLIKILTRTIAAIHEERLNCSCANALKEARFKRCSRSSSQL